MTQQWECHGQDGRIFVALAVDVKALRWGWAVGVQPGPGRDPVRVLRGYGALFWSQDGAEAQARALAGEEADRVALALRRDRMAYRPHAGPRGGLLAYDNRQASLL